MAQQSFDASVSAWVKQSERRMETVFKESAQDVISEMNEVGPSKANPNSFGTGNMPVDTGYLRASLQSGLNAPPNEMVFRPPPEDEKKRTDYDPEAVALTINGAKVTDRIFATYGAVYARRMEAMYGFVRLAAQNWQSIVNKRAAIVKTRVDAAIAAARSRR